MTETDRIKEKDVLGLGGVGEYKKLWSVVRGGTNFEQLDKADQGATAHPDFCVTF